MAQAGFPALAHKQDRCSAAALAAAEQLLGRRGARLTPSRRAVLTVLLEDHTALGAYTIMDRIDWRGRRPAPAMVYRALDFLVANGLAHKIESRKAFIACPQAGHAHKPIIMICTACSQVAECTAPAVTRAVARAARDSGFTPAQITVEVSGVCEGCR